MTEWIISSSVLMLIVIGLRAVLKGRVSLRLQYVLWLLVLVRLLVPVNFTESAISVIGAAERAMETTAMQAVTEIAQVHPPIQSFDEAYAQVVARYEASGVDVDTLTGSDLEALDYEAYEQMRAEVSIGEMVGSGLTILWIAGMAVTAACLLMTNLRFGLRLRRSRRALPVPGCDLPVYVTGAVDTPCLFGLMKPAIYLPADTPWDEAAMEHILTHEDTHYRHGDHIWAVLRCVCLAVHWYNPLVWVCASLSRRDGELACDEASIRVLGEEHRAAYGRTLIDMTCQKQRGMVGLTATTMNYSAKSLKERILLIARHPKTAAYTLVLVIALAALAVGCTFTGTPEETAEPTEPPTESVTEEVTEESTVPPTEPPTEPATEESTQEPTEPATEESTQEPTEPVDEEQLAVYQSLFRWDGKMIINRAAGHIYTCPEELDLYYVFYGGIDYPGDWTTISESEKDFLLAEGFWQEGDIQIMPAELLEAELQWNFGVGLDDVQIPEEWAYSPETDTYYSNHNDAYVTLTTVTGYTWLDEETVVLHLTVDTVHDHDWEEMRYDAAMDMTIRPYEGGGRILSNVPAE